MRSHWARPSQSLAVTVDRWSTGMANSRNLVAGGLENGALHSLANIERNATLFRSYQQWDFCCWLFNLTNGHQKQPTVRRVCAQCDANLVVLDVLAGHKRIARHPGGPKMHVIKDEGVIFPCATLHSHMQAHLWQSDDTLAQSSVLVYHLIRLTSIAHHKGLYYTYAH